MVPAGSSEINTVFSIVREDGMWTYYCGLQPIFQHEEDDQASFLLFTSNLTAVGACKQAEIIRTFGITKSSAARSQLKLHQEGPVAFYQTKPRGGPRVLTAEVRAKATQLLEMGMSSRDVAEELEIKHGTVVKAIAQNRLPAPKTARQTAQPVEALDAATDKFSRSEQDAAAEIGMACTRPLARVLGAFGKEPAGTHFEKCRDVVFGGVLAAIPALIANGLFKHLKYLNFKTGSYTRLQIILVLAYMALCRIKSVEQLQYHPPGELGKLLGLDRVPEVRCLRQKLEELSQGEGPEAWAAKLLADWMEADPDLAGCLYVDGHVRLYHGKQTKLPRHFVSRQRLFGTTGYFVNDAIGQPFFAWRDRSTTACWRR